MREISDKNAPPAVLSIAGSDSGGGAGIQADLNTFSSLGLHGSTCITAVTAQNTLGVDDFSIEAPALIQSQLHAVLRDLPIKAAKSGMLPDQATVRALASSWSSAPVNDRIPLVVDPVMVTTTGDPLIHRDAIDAIKSELLPAAALVTPNLDEAGLLTGLSGNRKPDLYRIGEALLALGCNAVLLKGGHAPGDRVLDLLFCGGEVREFRHARQPGEYHGTGCTLSAATCAYLAVGHPLADAVECAIDYVQRAIAAGYRLGRGKLMILNHRAGAG